MNWVLKCLKYFDVGLNFLQIYVMFYDTVTVNVDENKIE